MSPEQARGESGLDGRSISTLSAACSTNSSPARLPSSRPRHGRFSANTSPRRRGHPGNTVLLFPKGWRRSSCDCWQKIPVTGRPAPVTARLLRVASHTGGPSAPLPAPPSGHPEDVTIGRRTTGAPDTMSEADHLVARGLKAFNLFGGSGGAASKGHLDEARANPTRALALDPANARGLCAMGNLLVGRGRLRDGAQNESVKRGREMIFAALAADDRCAEVHSSMGKVALNHDDDFHAAERHIRRAVELEPSEPEALRLLEHRVQESRPRRGRGGCGTCRHRADTGVRAAVECPR